jgi:hypothetical protein
MVGTENNVSNYYNISNGKVVRSFGKNEPEGIQTTSRVNKNGDTVFEQNFDFIEGAIVDAKLTEHDEYGSHIVLTISDGETKADLQIKFDSAYGRSFLFKLPKLDVKSKVKIKPYSFVSKDNGKTITGLNVFNPNKVENAYTKDNPNGLPQLKKVKFNGKEQWDKTEQIEFLTEKYNHFLALFKEVEVSEEDEDLDF